MAQSETKGHSDWQPVKAPLGMFFCEGCLEDKAEAEGSPDPRYCLKCYQFLLGEAELGSFGHADWIPRPMSKAGLEGPAKPVEGAFSCNKTPDYGKHRAGRPKANVSIGKVAELTAQGYSLRGIAKELGVSHMTISRVSSGERK